MTQNLFKKTFLAFFFIQFLFLTFVLNVSAQDETTSLVVLPFAGDDDVRDALSTGIRIFEARISATGRFSFIGDHESEGLFETSMGQTGVSPTTIRNAQLDAAGRSYADWAIEVHLEEVSRDNFIVSIDIWEPNENRRIFSDSEELLDESNVNVAARLGLDVLAQRFLVSPIVLNLEGSNEGEGRLNVSDVSPRGTHLFVNNYDFGVVPGQFSNLPEGTVILEFRAEGYISEQRTVEISSRDAMTIQGVDLESDLVTIEIRCNIDEAEIAIDDQIISSTNAGEYVSFEVPATASRLRVSMSGYNSFTARLSLLGRSTRRFEISLHEQDGPDGVHVESAICSEINDRDHARLCQIPGGSFIMGDESEGVRADQGPLRNVSIEQDFYIYQSEVTVQMYRTCVEDGDCAEPGFEPRGNDENTARSNVVADTCNYGASGRDQEPMNCLNWHAANAYCSWANASLPTEAMWEYAVRGNDGRRFPWIQVNSEPDDWSCETLISALCDTDGPASTGTRPEGRSPFGLHDTAGNVAEWVFDTYDPNAYRNLSTNDPSSSAVTEQRVVRGGSFRDFPENLTAPARQHWNENARLDHVGFRCIVE